MLNHSLARVRIAILAVSRNGNRDAERRRGNRMVAQRRLAPCLARCCYCCSLLIVLAMHPNRWSVDVVDSEWQRLAARTDVAFAPIGAARVVSVAIPLA